MARHDLVEQAHLERAGGGDRFRGEEELHRRRPRDLAGEERARAPAGEDPLPGFEHPEHGFRAREADVGAVEHLHATGDARPVHRRDDRLVDVEVAQHRLGPRPELLAVVGSGRGEQRDVVAQVAAGAERVVDPGEDRDPGVGIVTEALPGVGEGVEVLEIERVAAGRTVDGDRHHVVVDGVVDRHGPDGTGLRWRHDRHPRLRSASQALAGIEQLDVPAPGAALQAGVQRRRLLQPARRSHRERRGRRAAPTQRARGDGARAAGRPGDRDQARPRLRADARAAGAVLASSSPRPSARPCCPASCRASRRATPATRSGPTPNPIPRWPACCSTGARRPCTVSGSQHPGDGHPRSELQPPHGTSDSPSPRRVACMPASHDDSSPAGNGSSVTPRRAGRSSACQLPATLVAGHMMSPAQQRGVLEVGLAPVQPMHEMVHVAPRRPARWQPGNWERRSRTRIARRNRRGIVRVRRPRSRISLLPLTTMRPSAQSQARRSAVMVRGGSDRSPRCRTAACRGRRPDDRRGCRSPRRRRRRRSGAGRAPPSDRWSSCSTEAVGVPLGQRSSVGGPVGRLELGERVDNRGRRLRIEETDSPRSHRRSATR